MATGLGANCAAYTAVKPFTANGSAMWDAQF
eukprot:CAMPEP_0174320938 /NCGR_PEP_ID=MMETSP0810-20121108/9913_1 /TAXON_ID=73025 ORGANISM="Eutreptiella gymnastica-like, Strain CCMP1594" /NCGR_SAMPLE_ID=MMETSP0810 /ASSEMBLY_ACC=CAM_ASM_000659 /LENGTH=30 /DNA_ID= /DNA_START= /DNA_END= /DNA_ORIENTATION=